MVEQYLHMVCAGSPILSSSTIFPIGVVGSARLLDMEKVSGSNPLAGTILENLFFILYTGT